MMPCKFRRNRIALLAALISMIAAPAGARQLYDNWNTAACNFTDVATLTIEQPILVQRIDIWFRWRRNQTTVRYTAALGSEVIASGELTRAECDPYQEAWCVARVEPNADLAAGTYTFRTERGGICQNPGSGGLGFIRVYGGDD